MIGFTDASVVSVSAKIKSLQVKRKLNNPAVMIELLAHRNDNREERAQVTCPIRPRGLDQ